MAILAPRSLRLSSMPLLTCPTHFAFFQDAVAPFSNADALRIIEEELGASIPDLFCSFSSAAVASASLGQVYKATLAVDGMTEVAVKVRVLPKDCREMF